MYQVSLGFSSFRLLIRQGLMHQGVFNILVVQDLKNPKNLHKGAAFWQEDLAHLSLALFP